MTGIKYSIFVENIANFANVVCKIAAIGFNIFDILMEEDKTKNILLNIIFSINCIYYLCSFHLILDSLIRIGRKIQQLLNRIGWLRRCATKFRRCLISCARILRIHRLTQCFKDMYKCCDIKKYKKIEIEKE